MAISDLHLFRPRLWPTAIVSRGRCDRRIAGKSQAHLDIRLRELGRASSGCYDSGRLDCEGDVQTWMLRLASAKHSVICVQERPAMNVILAEETSFGLRMMADATDTHTLWVLIRVRQWHVESEAYDRALARVVEAQAGLPIHGHSGFERRPIICRHSARRRPAAPSGASAPTIVRRATNNSPGFRVNQQQQKSTANSMGATRMGARLLSAESQLYRRHRTLELSILFRTFIQNPTRFVVLATA
ncbi:Tn3 family insertion sequence transposase domain-containing protein (plasmid) [Rhizobium phaseoli]|uniref:Tn3 family insertion sequence transposase domain-containing protein n=4 Tax=Rhizobium TaxID=379 RepID=A0ABN4QRV1_9HYPH|nr:probable insertion sequence transposase protein [Rhizobium etli CFN 42]ANL50102.1 Tn3 family insertion sequence transposase domain-containing protein [Rhizobium phaseoli]ANL75396.1 Tn3 family insertion sequence transposase domain-containing protein [Rhizobium phaseoli]ANL88230.1 Tn3 family insertion sequence transposase domain-containing protein [Rhizobium phaseoli]ANL94739.1 Tn3 family insertion sequence transposase domain-containing protein [Rhizobium phaseoli]